MNRLITSILYVLPILLTTILTKRITCFLLSAGIMTVILGLSMKLIPNVIGYKTKKQNNNLNYFIFIILAGVCLVIASSQI